MFALTPFNRRNSLISRNDFFNFDTAIDEFFNSAFIPAFIKENPIRADIKETDNEYIIEAEMPGVRKEDIKLELKNDTLVLSMERKEEKSEERDNYVRKERYYGACSRSFRVGGVREDAIKAKYEDGILSVTVPKKDAGKDKSNIIEIE